MTPEEKIARLTEALHFYEHRAQLMQRATLQGATKKMMETMQELALDGGAIARRAIEGVSK